MVLEEGQVPDKPLTRRRGKWNGTRRTGWWVLPGQVGAVGGGEEAPGGERSGCLLFLLRGHAFCLSLPVTSLVPLHMACVRFQPEGPDIKLFKAQVLFSTCVPGTCGAQL